MTQSWERPQGEERSVETERWEQDKVDDQAFEDPDETEEWEDDK